MEEDPDLFANDWFIYDSLNEMSAQNINAAASILQKFYPDESRVSVNCVNVIPQQNTYDCGLYTIAYVQCLLAGEDPALRVFDHAKMREEFNDFANSHCRTYAIRKFTSIAVLDAKQLKFIRIASYS
jgi:Ulp1 family protease